MTPTYYAPKEFLDAAYAALEEIEQEETNAPRETTEEDFESLRNDPARMSYADALADLASADTTYVDASHYDADEWTGPTTRKDR